MIVQFGFLFKCPNLNWKLSARVDIYPAAAAWLILREISAWKSFISAVEKHVGAEREVG